MKYAILTALFSAIIAMASCQKSSNKKVVKNEMYEASELALLMRSLETQLKQLGAQLDAGILPADSLSDYSKLHTAKATNPKEINEIYHGMADVFIAKAKEMNAQKEVELFKIHYNILVNSCISCHQVYCNGPIERISKLQINPPIKSQS